MAPLLIEERIVMTTPLLEALGNAKTRRNDNSSRFGKFLRLHLTKQGLLVGARVEEYLLEATRVTHQVPQTRSNTDTRSSSGRAHACEAPWPPPLQLLATKIAIPYIQHHQRHQHPNNP